MARPSYFWPEELEFSGRKAIGDTGVAHFSVSQTYSDKMVVGHQLGLTPKSVVAAPLEPIVPPFIVTEPYTFQTSNYTKDTFDVRAVSTGGAPPAGTDVPFAWIAISDDNLMLVDSGGDVVVIEGPPGPAGPAGPPGGIAGAAGGDLAGNYPDPTVRQTSMPDGFKARWFTDPTLTIDFAEVFGRRSFQEDFSTNPLVNYTLFAGTDAAIWDAPNHVVNGGGALPEPNGMSAYYRSSTTDLVGDCDLTMDVAATLSTNEQGHMVFRDPSSGWYLTIGPVTYLSGPGNREIVWTVYDNANVVQHADALGQNTFAIDTSGNKHVWIRITRVGTNYRCRVYQVSPALGGAPIADQNFSLTSGVGNLGGTKRLQPGWIIGHNQKLYGFGESFAAIGSTPLLRGALIDANGVRTERTIMRTDGKTELVPVVGYQTVRDETIALPQRNTLDFQGPGIAATDDPVNDKTIITVASAGGGSGGRLPWIDDFDGTKDFATEYDVRSGSFSGVSGGKLVSTANNSRARTKNLKLAHALVQAKVNLTAATNLDFYFDLDDNNWIRAVWQGSDGNLVFRVLKDGGASVVLGATGAGTAPIVGDNYLRMRLTGHNFMAAVYTSDPDVAPHPDPVRYGEVNIDAPYTKFLFNALEVAWVQPIAAKLDYLKVYD